MHIYGSDDTFEECIDTMDNFWWDIVQMCIKWYRIHFLLEYTLINWYRVIKEHDTNAYLLRICLIIWWRRKTELSVWHYFVFRRFDAYWIFPASIFLVLLALNLALIMLWVIYVLWHSLKTLSNREIFFGLAVILFRLLTI